MWPRPPSPILSTVERRMTWEGECDEEESGGVGPGLLVPAERHQAHRVQDGAWQGAAQPLQLPNTIMVPSGNNSRKGSTQITNNIDLTWKHGVDFRESVWELLYASLCPNPEGLKEK